MQNNVLTEFIKSIATASDTFAGRFVLLEGYGNDANSDNNTEVLVGNALNAVTWKKKYPCILMMPPRVTGRNRKNSTVRYLVTLFFCTTTYHNGTGGVKALNAQTGTSKRSIQDDWNDMQTNANEFYTYMLYRLYSDIRMLQSIRPVKDGATPMDFFSLKNDDKISGVSMTFELDLVDECAFETFINNRVIIGDFIVLNSDAFLEWLVNQELGYRYAITEIIVNGVPDMGTYYSADYYAVNSQIIPVQIGERQTVPNYDDDSEVGFHYDKNIIDFLNSNFILNIFHNVIKFSPSPYTLGNDLNYPVDTVRSSVVNGELTYGEAIQMEWDVSATWRFKLKLAYQINKGGPFIESHEIRYNSNGTYFIDGAQVDCATLKTINEFVF